MCYRQRFALIYFCALICDAYQLFLNNNMVKHLMHRSSPCKVTPIVSGDFTSVGDVLRDVDQKSLFETNFLLVLGDVVSNLQLKKALEEHKYDIVD